MELVLLPLARSAEPECFTFLSRYLRAFLNERPLKVCLYVLVSQKQISYFCFNKVLNFSFYYKDETIIILRAWVERREKWIRFTTRSQISLLFTVSKFALGPM